MRYPPAGSTLHSKGDSYAHDLHAALPPIALTAHAYHGRLIWKHMGKQDSDLTVKLKEGKQILQCVV